MPDQALARQNVDISIIGGGIVGVSLALLLSSYKCDWRIQVIEAQPLEEGPVDSFESHFDARSTALSQSSREIFEALGLWKTLSPSLTKIFEVHISDKGCLGSAKLTAEDQGLPALGYVVENRYMRAVLLDALKKSKDIEIIYSTKIDRLKAVRGGVNFSISRVGSDKVGNVNSKLLVIADGVKSKTRNMLGIDFTTKDYDQVAIVANILLSQNHNGVACERFTDSGPIAMLPLKTTDEGHRAALVWTVSPSQAERLLLASENEFLKQLQLCFGFRLGKFQRAGKRHSFPIKLVTSSEQIRSNVVVVGNATHSLHPVAGQGFNLALRDVAVLADQLAESVSSSCSLGEYGVLEGYIEHQKIDQERTILLSDLLPRIFGNTTLPVVVTRNIALLSLDIIPLFRRNFAKLGMGLQTKGLGSRGSGSLSSAAPDMEAK